MHRRPSDARVGRNTCQNCEKKAKHVPANERERKADRWNALWCESNTRLERFEEQEEMSPSVRRKGAAETPADELKQKTRCRRMAHAGKSNQVKGAHDEDSSENSLGVKA